MFHAILTRTNILGHFFFFWGRKLLNGVILSPALWSRTTEVQIPVDKLVRRVKSVWLIKERSTTDFNSAGQNIEKHQNDKIKKRLKVGDNKKNRTECTAINCK